MIGLGNIGSRIAELVQAIGMNIVAHNRTCKKQKEVKTESLDERYRRPMCFQSTLLATGKPATLFRNKRLEK